MNDGLLSSNPQTTALNVSAPADVSPTVSGDESISVGQGGSVVLTTADLDGIDPDNTANQLVFSVTAATAGWVALSSAPVMILTSFTEAQLEFRLGRIHPGRHTDDIVELLGFALRRGRRIDAGKRDRQRLCRPRPAEFVG